MAVQVGWKWQLRGGVAWEIDSIDPEFEIDFNLDQGIKNKFKFGVYRWMAQIICAVIRNFLFISV